VTSWWRITLKTTATGDDKSKEEKPKEEKSVDDNAKDDKAIDDKPKEESGKDAKPDDHPAEVAHEAAKKPEFVDRQLQKALDYLSTEMAKAK